MYNIELICCEKRLLKRIIKTCQQEFVVGFVLYICVNVVY